MTLSDFTPDRLRKIASIEGGFSRGMADKALRVAADRMEDLGSVADALIEQYEGLLRKEAARIQHLEGAVEVGQSAIDVLRAELADRIGQLEAHEQIETRVTHLWPGYHTHPSFRDSTPWWAPCPEQGLDCSRWEHRTETRTARKSSPWVPAEDGAS